MYPGSWVQKSRVTGPDSTPPRDPPESVDPPESESPPQAVSSGAATRPPPSRPAARSRRRRCRDGFGVVMISGRQGGWMMVGGDGSGAGEPDAGIVTSRDWAVLTTELVGSRR